MGNVITTPPNEVAVISGPRGTRMVIGGCAFKFWCIETCNKLSLELLTLEIKSVQAETIKGVRVNCGSVAQLKVKALKTSEVAVTGAGAGTQRTQGDYDFQSIQLAATHFLGEDSDVIRQAILRTMEGHQRQILGTLTVEEIYKDRAAFSERVRELVHDDLKAMGFELVSYTVTHIDDQNGYMESLGATQTALVKREAAEGKARNESEAQKKVAAFEAEAQIARAMASREAHVSVNMQKQNEAESDRDLNMKNAEYNAQVNKARAEAEYAGRIEIEKQQQGVIREKTQQEVVQAEVRLQITDRDVEREKKQMDGHSMAELMQEKNRAEAVRIGAQAEADRVRLIGEASAAATRAAGQAEADVLDAKAQAYKQYGEAALAQMAIDKMPAIAREMAAPLQKTKEMVFVSNDGNAASSFTGDISKMMSQVPATVKAISGVDVKDLLQKTANKHFGGDSKKAMAAAAAGAAGMSAMSGMSVSEKRAIAEAAMGGSSGRSSRIDPSDVEISNSGI